MKCPRCQHEVRDDDQFCAHCGLAMKKCPHCHQPLMENAHFCTYCGKPVEEAKQDYVGGYYQPIQPDEFVEKEPVEETDFKSIPVSRKVNKPLIVMSVAILVILSAVSYIYLEKQSSPQTSQEQVASQAFKVQGEIGESSFVGNINQGGHVAMKDDTLYIVNEQGQLVSMDRSTSQQKVIIDDKVEYVNIVGNTIYYTNKNHSICSSNLNGENQKVILNQSAYYVIVKQDKIYYQLDSDGEKIYVYDLVSNQNKKLNNRHSYNLNIVDDKIYYTSTDGIYCIGIDGKGDEKLVSGEHIQLIYSQQKLYYTSSGSQVQCFDLQTKKITNIIEGVSQLGNITEDDMFYYTREGLNRYHFETKETTLIDTQIPTSCEVLGDKLVLTYGKDEKRVIMDFDGTNSQRLFMSQDGDFI